MPRKKVDPVEERKILNRRWVFDLVRDLVDHLEYLPTSPLSLLVLLLQQELQERKIAEFTSAPLGTDSESDARYIKFKVNQTLLRKKRNENSSNK